MINFKKYTFKTLLFFTLLISVKGYSQEGFHAIKKVVPKSVVAQYAGSIGLISFGIYYPLYKEKLGISFHYGYVPEKYGGRLDIISSKLKYKPLNYPISETATYFPINPVFFTTYTLNDNFSLLWPKGDDGKRRSYWWSSALRLHLGVSSDLEIKNLINNTSVTVYFEANITDLYFTSYVKNPEYLSIWKTIRLGVGTRVKFL